MNCELCSDLSVSLDKPLVGSHFLKCHRTAWSEFLCGYANLGTKTELCSISETGWSIYIYASGINLFLECLCRILVLRDDALRMT